jgi:hypothetical protein
LVDDGVKNTAEELFLTLGHNLQAFHFFSFSIFSDLFANANAITL